MYVHGECVEGVQASSLGLRLLADSSVKVYMHGNGTWHSTNKYYRMILDLL